MKFGADRKRIATLGALVLVGGYVLWTNVLSPGSASTNTTNASPAATTTTPTPVTPSTQSDNARVNSRRGRSERPTTWNPSLHGPGAAIDPVKVDPTLRLDLLAKVQQVELSGAQRNLFQFGEAVKPPAPPVVLPPVKKITMGPQSAGGPAAPPAPPPTPVAPPITLKYYGFTSPRANPHKRAFFLDGDDIILASEGELIKRRYRLVKIGVNSVTMEDTQFKTEQTLPLAQELAG